ncbi:MAG: hypothetical protein J5930_11110 [Treponema sp.]|nr:hypothetical protein [Treponema sp.]
MIIIKKLFAVLSFSVLIFSLTSCSSKESIDGKWKFNDGSELIFNTKKGIYSAQGKKNSTSGTFELYSYGTLRSTDAEGNVEEYEVIRTDEGFFITFQGKEISLIGKPVQKIEELKGKYTADFGESSITFDFKPSKRRFTVTVMETSQNFTYSITGESLILFTDGFYADGAPHTLKIEGGTLRIDDEVLTRK